ncbi:hypothetical protein QOT17_003348 [Balamuthia mandrillaris]
MEQAQQQQQRQQVSLYQENIEGYKALLQEVRDIYAGLEGRLLVADFEAAKQEARRLLAALEEEGRVALVREELAAADRVTEEERARERLCAGCARAFTQGTNAGCPAAAYHPFDHQGGFPDAAMENYMNRSEAQANDRWPCCGNPFAHPGCCHYQHHE